LATAAVFSQLTWVVGKLSAIHGLVIGNLLLAAVSTLLLGILTYARFVLLNASGAIYVKERIRKRKKSRAKKVKGKRIERQQISKPQRESSVEKEKRVDRELAAPVSQASAVNSRPDASATTRSAPPLMAKMQKTTVVTATAPAAPINKSMSQFGQSTDRHADDNDDADHDEYSHLSKSERKRLRRSKQQNRRAA
jgi:hypothetical protein